MAWGALGFLWAIFTAGTLVNQVNRLSQGPVVNAVVQVSSIALAGATRKQTVMRIERLNGRWLVPSIAFSTLWQPKEHSLCAGQRWLLQLRLRPIHGNLNEGGFDSQRWAMSQR
ncbi:ComEC family competence protein [Serratia quinivorans]|nr:ComEC family competence protein [Serratia quinivorans]